MALPPILQAGPLPSELDFFTTTSPTTSISIVPLLSIDRVRLLTGIYGPFKPPQPSLVPLWLALYLRNKKKALLIPPEWMSVPALTETLRQETSQPGFAQLPFEWIGVSNSILRYSSEDVREVGKVRGLLKDIREARQSKVLAGVGMVNSVHLEMTGISMHEIAELRPFFSTAFVHLKSLQPASAQQAATAADTFDASFPLAGLDLDVDPYAFSQTPSQTQPPGGLKSFEALDPFSLSYSADPKSSTSAKVGMQEESTQSDFTFTDLDTTTATDAASTGWRNARGRPSNVSDSGYATTSRPAAVTAAAADKDAGDHSRGLASDRRPPRFNMDDDEQPDDDSMHPY